jgi:hemolysin activation/secretion protein
MPWKNWFLGGQYTLLKINAKFNISGAFPDVPGLGVEVQTAGLGLVSVYDSRNSNFWPSKGNWLELNATSYGEALGGDYDYLKFTGKWAQYFPVGETVTFVYRLDGQFIDGDAPFWDLSRIRLRGYVGGQLLDNVAVTAQAEIRWNFYNRWTALAFGGGGRIADTIGDLGDEPTNAAGGMGVRYMLVEEQKLSIGLDVAYAEGSNVSLYFQVGDWLAN